MYLSNLSILSRKTFWLILAILLSIVAISVHAIIRIKSTTAGTNSACAKVVTSSGNEFGGYLGIDAAQMRSSSSATDERSKVIVFTSDILIDPNFYITAEGHAVTISGQTVAEAGPNAKTTIWIDLNDDGIVNTAEETYTELSSVMASVYVFGGSDSGSIDVSGNTKTQGKISITMTGGEIGAIFAGGLKHSVNAKSVDIQVTGGSVHYVDLGTHGDSYYSLSASESINVLLQNCVYRSNVSVNGLRVNSYHCPNVTVYDYSDHRDIQSYTRFTPGFTNFVSPIEKNCFVMGGNVMIPEDKNIEARVLVVKENASINNSGTVSVPRCEDIHMLSGSVWTGNPIQTAHVNMSLNHYTYKDHYRTCSYCGTTECQAHVWSYTDNGDGTHTKYCGVCGYGYAEDCSMIAEYDNAYVVRNTCKYCSHIEEEKNTFATNTTQCTHGSYMYPKFDYHCAEFDLKAFIQFFSLCRECGKQTPYMYNYSGNSYSPYESLSALCQKLSNSATVKLYGTVFDNGVPEVLNIPGTLTLDMNGCDIEREIVVESGTLKIINKQFQPTGMAKGRYARITKPIRVSSSATIIAEKCHFNSLSVGGASDATYTLGDIKCDYMCLNSTSNLTLTGKVVVEKNLESHLFTGSNLPKGYIIGEMLADGTWSPLYDHKSTAIPTYVGPGEVNGYATTSYVALIPCENHKLTSATSQGATGHRGTCTLCGMTVTIAHDMTSGLSQSTSSSFNQFHKLKCSLCTYQEGAGYHDFDIDGKCVTCRDQAPASLRGTSSVKKRFFSSFDEAFQATGLLSGSVKLELGNSPLLRGEATTYTGYDTIALYRDQVKTSASHTSYPLDAFVITGRGILITGPHIFIEGNGHTLGNSGTFTFDRANSRTYPSMYRMFEASHDLKYAYSLYYNTTGNYNMLVPEAGYYANKVGDYVVSKACDHAKPCSTCGVAQSTSDAVARVYTPGSDGPKEFTNIVDAWYEAADGLEEGVRTIQLLKDVVLPYSAGSLTFFGRPEVVWIGTDDNGIEHKFECTGARPTPLINIPDWGHLTIKSGIFQSYQNAIKAKGTSSLTIEGGTFLKGTDTSGTYEGLINTNSPVISHFPDGSFLMDDGEVVPFEENGSPKLSISGRVATCTHSDYVKYESSPRTCVYRGTRSCIYCNICNSLIDLETGARLSGEPWIADSGYGHTWVNGVCSRCGAHNGSITYQLNGGATTASDFCSVWAKLSSMDAFEDECTIQLQNDVTLTPNDVLPHIEMFDLTIDLKGHTLDLGSCSWPCMYNSITIIDSSNSGKSVVKGSGAHEFSHIVLDGVEYQTAEFSCINLEMKNNAGIVFDGSQRWSTSIKLKNLSMEPGCWMQGDNCGSIVLKGGFSTKNSRYEIDLNEAIADLAHDVITEFQIGTGEWVPVSGLCKFNEPDPTSFKADNIMTITSPNGKNAGSCYRWKATMTEGVRHTLNGRKCTECGLNTQHYLLHDKTAYSESYTNEYLGTEYKRNFANANVWESLYVPMSVGPSAEYDIADIYSFGQLFDTNGNGKLDAGDDTWLIVDMMTEATVANAPYLIRPKNAGETIINAKDNKMFKTNSYTNSCSTAYTTYTFYGSNAGSTLSTQNANFVMDANGKLNTTSAASVAPLRWHVQAKSASNSAELRQAMSSGIRVMVIGEDISQETAIKLLKGESVDVDLDGQHYTLDGRKATATESGLKIVNGKKVIVK